MVPRVRPGSEEDTRLTTRPGIKAGSEAVCGSGEERKRTLRLHQAVHVLPGVGEGALALAELPLLVLAVEAELVEEHLGNALDLLRNDEQQGWGGHVALGAHLQAGSGAVGVAAGRVCVVDGADVAALQTPDDVADLEDLDGKHGALEVGDGADDAGQQRDAAGLELGDLGVLEQHGPAVGGLAGLGPPHALVHVLQRVQDGHEGLLVAAGGQNVANRASGVGDGPQPTHGERVLCDAVVAESNGNVLAEVARVLNVGAADGDAGGDGVAAGVERGVDHHALEVGADVVAGELGDPDEGAEVGHVGHHGARAEVGGEHRAVGVLRVKGLHGVGLGAVLREAVDEHVQADAALHAVSGRDLDEDVAGVEGDLGVGGVGDGRPGADPAGGVAEDGVELGALEDLELRRAVLPAGVAQRREHNVLGALEAVDERLRNAVHVVGADSGEGALAAQVLVQLGLQVDQAVVDLLRHADAPQAGGEDVGAGDAGLRGYRRRKGPAYLGSGLHERRRARRGARVAQRGGGGVPLVGQERGHEAFQAEEVVPAARCAGRLRAYRLAGISIFTTSTPFSSSRHSSYSTPKAKQSSSSSGSAARGQGRGGETHSNCRPGGGEIPPSARLR
ncbi:uncharacterized protein BcabD6B2_06230 [Babesia caballi]|uniref:Uncharacterized protein n=1 Tax=Babesia caballi TaxID=5871 RepID=A0AAV4LN73_BABCB|nr:hypothetical protein, conserved [Babesia caballi]